MGMLNHNKGALMSDAILSEMRDITRRAAEPWSPGDSAKAAIGRSARRLRLTYRRAYTFWYAAPAAVRAEEADRLRAIDKDLLKQRRENLQRQLAEIEARLDARVGAPDVGLVDGLVCKTHVSALGLDR